MLEDVLGDGLAVVFCGISGGFRSTGRDEAYYASARNKFWGILARTKLTPRQFRPEEFRLLLAHDIGLTDLAKTKLGAELDLGEADFDVVAFRKRIAENTPRIVAFNGKEAAKRVLNKETVRYGKQKETIGDTVVYVMPSTSDQAKDFWDEKHWIELAAEVRKLRNAR